MGRDTYSPALDGLCLLLETHPSQTIDDTLMNNNVGGVFEEDNAIFPFLSVYLWRRLRKICWPKQRCRAPLDGQPASWLALLVGGR